MHPHVLGIPLGCETVEVAMMVVTMMVVMVGDSGDGDDGDNGDGGVNHKVMLNLCLR